MGEMYVKAKFYKNNIGAYAGMDYIFKTRLNVVKGSLVWLPCNDGTEQKGIITETYVSESEIEPQWADRVMEITEHDTYMREEF